MSKKSCIIWNGVNIECDSDSSSRRSPSSLQEFEEPLMVCRDCGCVFGMKSKNPPDFKELLEQDFEMEILEPNDHNVVYFNFMTNKSKPVNCPPGCLPPKVICRCPLCRPRHRPGYHFRDCTCQLCLVRRDACLNRYRYEVLASRQKARCSKLENTFGSTISATLPLEEPEVYEDDREFIPRNPSPRCPCHSILPTNWYVSNPCPAKPPSIERCDSIASKEPLSMKKSGEIQHAVEVKPLVKYLTPSLSQNFWPLEAKCYVEKGAKFFQNFESFSDPCILNSSQSSYFLLTKKSKYGSSRPVPPFNLRRNGSKSLINETVSKSMSAASRLSKTKINQTNSSSKMYRS